MAPTYTWQDAVQHAPCHVRAAYAEITDLWRKHRAHMDLEREATGSLSGAYKHDQERLVHMMNDQVDRQTQQLVPLQCLYYKLIPRNTAHVCVPYQLTIAIDINPGVVDVWVSSHIRRPPHAQRLLLTSHAAIKALTLVLDLDAPAIPEQLSAHLQQLGSDMPETCRNLVLEYLSLARLSAARYNFKLCMPHGIPTMPEELSRKVYDKLPGRVSYDSELCVEGLRAFGI